MTPSEIILQDSERNGVDGQQLLNGIAQQVKDNKAALIHKNNSVLTMSIINEQPHSFALHLFTLDAPLTLMKSLSSFVKTIRQMEGIQSVYGDTDNKQLLALLNRIGVDVLDSDLEGYTWMAKV